MNKDSALARNVFAIRTHYGYNQETFAKLIGVSQTTMSKWETSGHKMSDKNIKAIMDTLPVSYDDIMSDENGFAKNVLYKNAPDNAILPRPTKTVYLPLRGRVHAGKAQEPDTFDEQIPVFEEFAQRHPKAYFLEVEGDCMNKVYPEGCLILIDPDKQPQNGSVAAVTINGADAVMRRLYKGANTIVLSPDSFNTEHGDIVIHADDDIEVALIGTVVWFQPSKEME